MSIRTILSLFLGKEFTCDVLGHVRPYYWGYEYYSNTKIEKCRYCYKKPLDGKVRMV